MELKQILINILSIIIVTPFIACSSTSAENERKNIYVMPTNYGKHCLNLNDESKSNKRNYSIKRLADGDGYEMTVFTNTFTDGKTGQFHEPGMAYIDDDLDVMLFGIGTNEFNSVEASTLLYASTANKDISVDKGDGAYDFKNDEKEEINKTKLITGVEYAYGTGPLKGDFGTVQTVWLKTTVMESNKGGYYTESSAYNPTYTKINVKLVDTIAPVLNKLQYSFTQEFLYDSQENSKENLDETIIKELEKQIAQNYMNDFGNRIDEKETPKICEYSFPENLDFSKIKALDTIEANIKLSDEKGNISENYKVEISFDICEFELSTSPYYYYEIIEESIFLGQISLPYSYFTTEALYNVLRNQIFFDSFNFEENFYDIRVTNLNKLNLYDNNFNYDIINVEQIVHFILTYKDKDCYYSMDNNGKMIFKDFTATIILEAEEN